MKLLSKNKTRVKKTVRAIYQQKGQAAAFQKANEYPIHYEYCYPCDIMSPQVDHVCLICGHETKH